MKTKLTKSEARQLALKAQFHFQRDRFDSGPQGTLEAIEHLGYVQIDSISVVERAHHHTLWSRQEDYRNTFIDTLQENSRQIFEYWAHAAAYLSLKDYRFCLPRMRRVKKEGFEWFTRDKRIMRYVHDRIKREGPLQAGDFKEMKHKPGPWWGWKPAKIALEHLFMEGTLMVAKRDSFRKVYDLAERVLPPETNTKTPTQIQSAEYLIERGLRAMGIASKKDIAYQRKDGIDKVQQVLKRKVKKGDIAEVEIEGTNDTYYVEKSFLHNLEKDEKEPLLRILSPFDNFVINRRRLKELFDFDYRLECYVPPGGRRFGYFSLPILYKDRFPGILDAKAERSSKRLVIKNLHLEQLPGNPEDTEIFTRLFSHELQKFMVFNRCETLEIEKTYPQDMHDKLLKCVL